MVRRVALLLCCVGSLALGQEQDESEAPASEEPRVRRLGDSLAVDPTREWVPSFDASAVARETERKLALAEEAFAAGNLVTPAGESALAYLREILAAEPGNAAAAEGVQRVAQALLGRARAAAEAGERGRALATLRTMRSLELDAPGRGALETALARAAEVDDLLARAEERFAAGALLEPDGESALAAYEAVLAIDAGNERALAGLSAIRSALVDRAVAAAQADDLAGAEALAGRAERVPGDEAILSAAFEAIATAREARRAVRLGAIEAQVAAGEVDAAERALARLLGEGLPAGERVVRIERAIARVRRLAAYEAGATLSDRLAGGGDGPTLVVIPAGRFELGSPRREDGRDGNEGPPQEITFAIPYALARTEVTVADFRRFVEATGYVTDAERGEGSTIYNVLAGSLKDEPGVSWRNDWQGQAADDGEPVVHVSWNDAQAYAAWLAAETGERYRLPSESEFEYALRAGTTTPYWWGRSSPEDEVENLTGEDDRMAGRWEWPDPFADYGDGHWGPAPVASFEPNPFGLHDAGGNVMEWVADCYVATLEGVPTDGSARTGAEGCNRVLKGGSWATPPSRSRSAQRTATRPTRATALVGFRIARDL